MGFFWTVLLQLLYFYTSIYAFNLDTHVPIIKEGRGNSYFGFSVAQHQIFEEHTGSSKHV